MTRKMTAIGTLAAAFLAGAAGSARAYDFSWPVTGRVTSTYWSWRGNHYHKAIDIGAPTGTRVGAARGGKIIFRKWDVYGGGWMVKIGHGAGYVSGYAHNSRFSSATGYVSRGTIIAYVGSSGNATGPHSHFQIERYGTRKYIPARLYQSVTRGYGIAYNYSGI